MNEISKIKVTSVFNEESNKITRNPMTIAKFEKVPFKEFLSSLSEWEYKEDQVMELYNNIKLPKRATTGSAGYDFFAPLGFCVESDKSIVIPTGIRCDIDTPWFLMLCPRSGQGFKYGLRLHNTVGIIDSDYYYADNYGHIKVKLSIEKGNNLVVPNGTAFCQGIFMQYGIAFNDDADGIRVGGFGSTDK